MFVEDLPEAPVEPVTVEKKDEVRCNIHLFIFNVKEYC